MIEHNPLPDLFWHRCLSCVVGDHDCAGAWNLAAPERQREPCECLICEHVPF